MLDFKEIPEARGGAPDADQFELFARDALELLGFKVVSAPGRGPDGGRDLIVEETREGPAGSTVLRWLVSCKHNAHSGRAVGVDDELNILDRVRAHGCNGFVGVYSTVPSSALVTRVEALRPSIEALLYDSGKLEHALLSRAGGLLLAQRYFPKSYSEWKRENPGAAKIRVEAAPLPCDVCGKDLLSPPSGIVVVATSTVAGREQVVAVRCVCKGPCDRQAERALDAAFPPRVHTTWEDIPDYILPTVFLNRVTGTLTSLDGRLPFSTAATNEYIDLIVAIFPFVARDLTSAEDERLTRLLGIPSYLGGIGA